MNQTADHMLYRSWGDWQVTAVDLGPNLLLSLQNIVGFIKVFQIGLKHDCRELSSRTDLHILTSSALTRNVTSGTTQLEA